MNPTDDILKQMVVIPLSCHIEKHGLPNCSTREEKVNFLRNLVENFGGFEVYSEPFETHKSAIDFLINRQLYSSAVALIALTLEEDINFLLRVGSVVKGYTHKDTDEIIKSLNFRLKIEFVLPLLNIQLTEQYKTAVFEFQRIRNEIIHHKSRPNEWRFGGDDKNGSTKINTEKAESLLKRYDFQKLVNYSDESRQSLLSIKSIHIAINFLDDYFDERFE